MLSDDNAFARTYAAYALVRIGDESTYRQLVGPLTDALKNDEAYWKRHSLKALRELIGRIDLPPETEHEVVRLLNDSNSEVRVSAACALVEMGSTAEMVRVVTLLAECAADPWTDLRRAARDGLRGLSRRSRVPQAVDALLTMLRDPQANVRTCAASAAMQLGNCVAEDAIVMRLLELLDDEDVDVSEAAAWSLGYVVKPDLMSSVVSRLVSLLALSKRWNDYKIRNGALESLVRLSALGGGDEVVSSLMRSLEPPSLKPLSRFAYEFRTRDSRKRSVRTLGRIGATAATPRVARRLVPLLRDLHGVREEAAHALSQLQKAVPELQIWQSLGPRERMRELLWEWRWRAWHAIV